MVRVTVGTGRRIQNGRNSAAAPDPLSGLKLKRRRRTPMVRVLRSSPCGRVKRPVRPVQQGAQTTLLFGRAKRPVRAVQQWAQTNLLFGRAKRPLRAVQQEAQIHLLFGRAKTPAVGGLRVNHFPTGEAVVAATSVLAAVPRLLVKRAKLIKLVNQAMRAKQVLASVTWGATEIPHWVAGLQQTQTHQHCRHRTRVGKRGMRSAREFSAFYNGAPTTL